MELRLEAARASDIDRLVGLMKAYYEYDRIEFNERVARGRLDELLCAPALGWVWLVHAEQQICGYVAVTKGFGLEHGRNATIDELFIEQAFRSKGVGSRVLDIVEDLLRKEGIVSLHTDVERTNHQAIEFWQKRDFKRFDRYPLVKMLLPPDSHPG